LFELYQAVDSIGTTATTLPFRILVVPHSALDVTFRRPK
jgi:hypothetical protein